MRELLEQQSVFDGTVTVTKCDGDVNVLVLHGKKRLGFDFEELKFDFKIAAPTPAEGTAVCELDSALPDDWEVCTFVLTRASIRTHTHTRLYTNEHSIVFNSALLGLSSFITLIKFSLMA